jgi:hypothetical protein
VLLVCTVYRVLYSEIALSRKPIGIGHMYIYTFLLRITHTMTSQNIEFSPGTFCILSHVGHLSFVRPIVSLFLYFHKRDEVTFVHFVRYGLCWTNRGLNKIRSTGLM